MDVQPKLAPGETPATTAGDMLRESAQELEFVDGGLQAASFILCLQKLGQGHQACIDLFNQAVLSTGPTFFPKEHAEINACMKRQAGKSFDRALRNCRKPYEKLWTQWGTWFEEYYKSLTGQNCGDEFESLRKCVNEEKDLNDEKARDDVVSMCASHERKLVDCRTKMMFFPLYKDAERCAGRKTDECAYILRQMARAQKLGALYQESFWGFISSNFQEFSRGMPMGAADVGRDDEEGDQ